MNEADVDEIPEHLRRDLTFVFVEWVPEVLEAALEVAADERPCAARQTRTARPRATPKARV